MAFLLNSQVLGVSGKNKQSPWHGSAEARGPIQLHRSRCITCQDACVKQSHAAKVTCGKNAYYHNLRWTFADFCRVLLRNKDQQYNSSHVRFATCLSRQKSGHAWTAGSSLHDTRTV